MSLKKDHQADTGAGSEAKGEPVTVEKPGLYIEIVTEDEKSVIVVGESRLYYRRMDFDAWQEIRRKHTKEAGKNAAGVMLFETDEVAVDRDTFMWMLTDFENVKHPVTGEFVPVTEANKLKMPNSVKNLIIGRAFSTRTEKEIKN